MKEICKNCFRNMEMIDSAGLIALTRETHWCSLCGTVLILRVEHLSKNLYCSRIGSSDEQWKIPQNKP